MARASFSYAELKKAAFFTEMHDPDDLIKCPFVENHFLKRKKLPYHIRECIVTNGKGFLPCPYSQYHYFRTKEELKRHECLCPSRPNKCAVAAPSLYDDEGNSLHTPLLPSFTNQRPEQQRNLGGLSQTSSTKGTRIKDEVQEDPEPVAFSQENTQRRELRELSKTVLFSRTRRERVLKLEGTEKHDGASDGHYLSTVAEEPEEPPEDVSAIAAAPVVVQHLEHKTVSSAVKSAEVGDLQREDKERPKLIRKRLDGPELVGARHISRFEDDRDAREDPKNYPVDWSFYPKYYRAKLKAKYTRDNEIYRTGINPRYRKALDYTGADRRRIPDPLQFQLFAAWFEDLVWKADTVPQN